jgi:hypothetical protein
MRFLEAFLTGLINRRRNDLLAGAWLPLHNYFLNHPLDYPYDPVNLSGVPLGDEEIQRRGLSATQVQSINLARTNARQPGGFYVGSTVRQDSNGFRKYEAYAAIFYDYFGYYIPIISTEGGPIAGDNQDPRYPPVTDADVTELTLRAYQAMLDEVPSYYFAFTPWLLANQAGGHWDVAWENAAWYKLDGSHLPVVDRLKSDPGRFETRSSHLSYPVQPVPTTGRVTVPSPPPPTMMPLTTAVIVAPGTKPNWQVAESEWLKTANRYGQISVNVLDESGRPLSDKQVRVAWSTGWTLLLTDPKLSTGVSLPIAAPTDVYQISIAGDRNLVVQAAGAEGYSLRVIFRRIHDSP